MPSKKMITVDNLAALGVDRLATILVELANDNADVKRHLRLELAAQMGDDIIAAEIARRITALRSARSFLDWQKQREFVKDLDPQRAMIVDRVADTRADLALDQMWRFMDLAEPVINRVDDSNGAVGDVFRFACEDLGTIAIKAKPDAVALADRVFTAVRANDYGMFDDLVTTMLPALGGTGTERLKGRLTQALADRSGKRPVGTSATVLHVPWLRLAAGAWSAQGGPIQCPETRRAVQTPCRASPSHSEASLSGHELPEYDTALRRRGSLTVWFTGEAIAAWRAEPRTTPGGQPYYSALAITTALTPRAVFHLALRQTEGLIGSVIALLGLALTVPDHSTMCRRSRTLALPPLRRSGTGPLHLLVDSTGLKLGGAGEWLVEKHGTSRRRSWRKLHIGIDAGSGEIVAIELTANDVDDAARTGALLDQVSDPIASFTADGAYDQDRVYEAVADRHPGASVIVPPVSTATLSASAGIAPTQRDQHIHEIVEHGRMGWQKSCDYNVRAKVEAAIGRYKRVIGDALRSQTDKTEATEVAIAAAALNRMPGLGRPNYVRIV